MPKEVKGVSTRLQWIIDDLFMPRSVTQAVQEIKLLQAQQKVRGTSHI